MDAHTVASGLGVAAAWSTVGGNARSGAAQVAMRPMATPPARISRR